MADSTLERTVQENSSQGELKFPESNEQNSGMWLTLIEFDYHRPTLAETAKPKTTGTRISLPIPTNLGASYGLDWDTSETRSAVSAFIGKEMDKQGFNVKDVLGDPGKAAQAAYSKMKDTTKGMSISDILQSKAVGDFVKEGAVALATDLAASSPILRQLGAQQGVARNPFLAAAFKGVNFRHFDFAYKFFPRNLQESQTLEKIITTFKLGMHPSYEPGYSNQLFRYPNMYLPVLVPNKWLFDFTFCVIDKFAANYHGMDSPAYFNSNGEKIPACIEISFGLQEIEIITKETLKATQNIPENSSAGLQNASGISTFRGR